MASKRQRHQKRKIVRSDGITESEKYLSALCEKTFLSLWSYPNAYRDQGTAGSGVGKELCDLLVVFGNHIIIFSDKHIEFPKSGNLQLDWNRWFKKAIEQSANQVYGAERWIKSFPDRVYLDKECRQLFPVTIPTADSMIVHRIVVAHGVSEASKSFFGGSGSLMLDNRIIGKDHYIEASANQFSFMTVGQVNPTKGFVHVLDDTSLEILLNTLDTTQDFVTYLEKKERFLLSDRLIRVAGEEELLAIYLTNLNDQEEHDFAFEEEDAHIFIGEGFWEEFETNPQRLAQLEADKVSYGWDALIENFNKHIREGTQYATTDGESFDSERIMRFMASESRFRRRLLANCLRSILIYTPKQARRIRVIPPDFSDSPYYLFLLFPYTGRSNYAEYRKIRMDYLEIACRVLRANFEDALDIVGIAMETGLGGKRSEDSLYLDGRNWSKEEQAEALKLQNELNILTNYKEVHLHEKEYPEKQGSEN